MSFILNVENQPIILFGCLQKSMHFEVIRVVINHVDSLVMKVVSSRS